MSLHLEDNPTYPLRCDREKTLLGMLSTTDYVMLQSSFAGADCGHSRGELCLTVSWALQSLLSLKAPGPAWLARPGTAPVDERLWKPQTYPETGPCQLHDIQVEEP